MAFQAIGLLILLAVLYSVLVAAVAAHRRATRLDAIYVAHQRALNARVEQALEERNIERKRDELTWQGYRKLEVTRKAFLGDSGICEFEFTPRDGRPLPPYRPGQFITFRVAVGPNKQTAVRCYSLADKYRGGDKAYRIAIKKVLRPPDQMDLPDGIVSSYFHDRVRQGDILDVRAPAGSFVLDETRETPVVLVAGGIGITPLWSMLSEIVDAEPQREAWFFYGVRHGGEQILREEIERIKRSRENVHVRICYSSPCAGDNLGQDYHHKGRVTIDYLKQELPSNQFEFFICGPRRMMSDLTEGLGVWDVPKSRINVEAFGAPAKSPSPQTGDLTVTFTRSKRTIPWNPGVNTILEFAEENDIPMEFGCRAGSCGECKVAVRDGGVEYVREPEFQCEEGCCLTCVAIPQRNLVLEA